MDKLSAEPETAGHVLALADDMTGALEIGAQFSGAGIRAVVSAQPLSALCAPVVVLDTESRHLTEDDAASEVRRFLQASGSVRPRLLYKKTDSTLRGNIQAELRAIAELFPEWTIGYAPAYPALGRTVKAGVLYVHGKPVAYTEFARDLLNPVTGSSVSEMMKGHVGCTVFDSDTDEELLCVARMMMSHPTMRIAAGPSALAGVIAQLMDIPRRNVPSMQRISTCLVLNGSRHKRSAQQIRNFVSGRWQVLAQAHGAGSTAADTAAANSRLLVAQIAQQNPDAVFVIGGDTAFALIRELGFPPMNAIAEIVPGVPVTRLSIKGRERDLILITKAGGFGDDQVLNQVQERFRS